MNTVEIIFSPTGGTEKVAHLICKNWSEHPVRIDLSDAGTDYAASTIAPDDRVLIAMPSFGGRAPAVAIERLKQIKGNGAACTLVCVYGNRAYEDTLVELEDAAKQAGFQVIAAVAAIAEHSIARQFAAGRPDAQDAAQLSDFAKQIQHKLSAADTSEPAIPGNRPYKKAGGAGMMPKATKECTNCGVCAAECPVQTIDKGNPKKVDEKACISCMRCITVCPQGARKLNPVMLSAASLMLKKVCSERKECELFL